ncbi:MULTISPECIES: hypothetical protein [unclassified Nocardiopsis]|uniref:hypothetical protein n=1 Tax=unclassified Nocardiopsis TaxID=2649073 RepID=UPI001358534C|nr:MULTISPECIES: hypothetical protein [unclassified Nocardiopsis]
MAPNPGAGALGARLLLSAALVAGTVLGATSPAFAKPDNAPGDNGTVKIHDPSTPEDDNRNVPKVCDFQIVADNFDAVQEISWEIFVKAQGGWSEEPVLEGELVLDDQGSGSTEFLDLDNGHYKLYWTFEGQRSNDAKHKVFKVACEETPEPTPGTPTEEPSGEPSEEPTTAPSGEPTENPGESPEPTDPGSTVDPTDPANPTDPAGEPGTDASVPPAADEENAPADEASSPGLAVTGGALTALVAAGAVAVAGGGAAVYFTRRRKNADVQE